MNVFFNTKALLEFKWFINNNKKIAERILQLIESIKHDPFAGIGKPKPLKHEIEGTWSRRIDNKNRLIYRIINKEIIEIVKCKGHYYD